MNELPTWDEWTIDLRLRQFRRVDGTDIEFVSFDSEEGKEIIKEYCQWKHDDLCEGANGYLQVVFSIDDGDFEPEDVDIMAKEMAENNPYKPIVGESK